MKFLKILAKVVLGFSALVLLYLFVALLGTLISTGNKDNATKGDIEIFVHSNGFHTSFIVPLQYKTWNWLEYFEQSYQKDYQSAKYMAFGWGDKGFYLRSKTQSNGLGTALNALFLPSKSIMHARFLTYKPKESEKVVKLCITEKQLQKLNVFILKSFLKNKNNKVYFFEEGYGQRDFFFKAVGKYSLFYTCNNWTNRGLKKMKIRTGLWTPFAQGIMYHFR